MKTKMRAVELWIMVISMILLLTPGAVLCKWPTNQLSIVVPFSPGGTTDRIPRALTPFLEKELGVPVVDPAIASLKLAEIFVSMGISTSRIAYNAQKEKKLL